MLQCYIFKIIDFPKGPPFAISDLKILKGPPFAFLTSPLAEIIIYFLFNLVGGP